MALSQSAKMLLILIGATKYVEGSTRLQKYGLLVSKKIGQKEEFFSDWQPDKFGVFSKSLAKTVTMLANEGLITADKVNTYGKDTIRYRITDSGRGQIQDIIREKKDLVDEICGIPQYYFGKSLKEVLADVYTLYPEYTTNSTIKHEVNKNRIEQESLFEESEFDIPFKPSTRLTADITNLITRTPSEHVFNDEDVREKLAKQIGLKNIPSLDSGAFDRLAGMLRNKVQAEKIDSVDVIRNLFPSASQIHTNVWHESRWFTAMVSWYHTGYRKGDP
ncbi:hypothetical protein [Candidatus Nitrosotenuis uzonensis]|uniref:Uncharacterized protein n=1 Tax=Candidatus Nitrosotenuis uzonensis TaxID=1407055 RepID=V6ARF6_9ARCH|nr:hypothetical protein [Candidatus Nitrosotenuis uzonensis]CDI05321.1 hypothetical protein NITUZ_30013 [Candidatus Nitrosotenuis uzonensis]